MVTAAEATLILDHVLGDPSFSASVAEALLAALPSLSPSHRTRRLCRAVLLRNLAADPVSESALETLHLLASLPASASHIAAAHIAVAAFLVVSAPDFDATVRELFPRPNDRAVDEGGSTALASDVVIATADQFEAAVGNYSSQTILRGLWGNRAAAEERVRDLLAVEWAAIGPSKLVMAAERIVGDGAVETWRAADEATRAKLRILAGEENTRVILAKLEEPASNANPISTPAVEKAIDALKTSCADLHNVVEDPLPAVKAVADEVLAARMDKGVSFNAEGEIGQPTTCDAAGPSKPHLPSPRRMPPSPLPPQENISKHRRARKCWSLLEEETLRNGVQQYGIGNWRDILNHNLDIFIGRTTVDLKDKWRNMT
ncbi:uncharacterized protein LOC8078023 [Sorghum bicolor]|uniref:uncharacterized protein LOC8078023 n=1 Tax=Sorghum bicolor TaxID=4558 RepID=UPI0001A832C8|nr:uncharacterized protein LOC8078023 [Sorghum bicolor]|eukprot:XP_021303973.1 uncharacterized protein LOC8078023 [Sorghum bicolor]